jgi:hypothetical protein
MAVVIIAAALAVALGGCGDDVGADRNTPPVAPAENPPPATTTTSGYGGY